MRSTASNALAPTAPSRPQLEPSLSSLHLSVSIRVDGLCLHYREAGAPELPHLVLLHPSPRSSAMYEPWMKLLAPYFHVVAVDTPGYGGSDPLPNPVTQMSDYLTPLHALLQTVAGPQCLLYGSATGDRKSVV